MVLCGGVVFGFACFRFLGFGAMAGCLCWLAGVCVFSPIWLLLTVAFSGFRVAGGFVLCVLCAGVCFGVSGVLVFGFCLCGLEVAGFGL